MGQLCVKRLVVPNDLFLEEACRYLRTGKKVCIHVRGNSMLPFLREGDRVVLTFPRRAGMQRGCIVLALTEYGYLLHRVIRVKSDALVLAGDAHARITESCTCADVAGVVIEAYRNGKPLHINGWLKRMASGVWMLFRPFRGVLRAIVCLIHIK